MGVSVVFDLSTWRSQYPAFAAVADASILNVALPIAQLFLPNDGTGIVCNAITQATLLGLIMAHVTQLMFGINGQPATGLVGRISNATEGSVSVSTDFPQTVNSAWYNQTPFGAAFWAATAPFRTMRYVPGRPRIMNPWRNQ